MAAPIPLFRGEQDLCDQLEGRAELDSDVATWVGKQAWGDNVWRLTADFLVRSDKQYTKQSFPSERGKIEIFLFWAYLIKERNPLRFSTSELREYSEFLSSVPGSWAATELMERDAEHGVNKQWRPIVMPGPIGSQIDFVPGPRTPHITVIENYYAYLCRLGLIQQNPCLNLKLADPQNVRSSGSREFTREEWEQVYRAIRKVADAKTEYELHLFTLVTIKSLSVPLRLLASDSHPSLKMSDIELNSHGGAIKRYGLNIALSESYVAHLNRYREILGISNLDLGDSHDVPLLSQNTGRDFEGMSLRQITKVVNEVFEIASSTGPANLRMSIRTKVSGSDAKQ